MTSTHLRDNDRDYKSPRPYRRQDPFETDSEDSLDEEEIQHLHRQKREIKNQTLESSRRAVRNLIQTEDIAKTTLLKTGAQTEQICRMDRQLTQIQQNTDISAQKANDIKRYNRSIFLPSFSFFGKKARKKKEEKSHEENFRERMEKKEEVRSIIYESKQRSQLSLENNSSFASKSSVSPSSASSYSKSNRLGVYNDGASSDDSEDVEKDIENNLSIMSQSISKLKAMSLAMNEELEIQNTKLHSLNDKTAEANSKINRMQYKMKKLL